MLVKQRKASRYEHYPYDFKEFPKTLLALNEFGEDKMNERFIASGLSVVGFEKHLEELEKELRVCQQCITI